MHAHITTDIINHECPRNMQDKDCSLLKWLNDGQNLFSLKWELTPNGEKMLHLTPTRPLFMLARRDYVQAIEEMNQICAHCEAKTK